MLLHFKIMEKSDALEYMMDRYQVSEATLSRIKSSNLKYDDGMDLKLHTVNWIANVYSNHTRDIVTKYCNKEMTPFVSQDVADAIFEETGLRLKPSKICKMLRENWGYSYKKGSSRMINYDEPRMKALKVLFAIKIWRTLSSEWVLVSIDESSISRSTKQNYSWIRTGKSGFLKNNFVKGSRSLVSSICSNGISFTTIVKGTTKSGNFKDYLARLVKYLEEKGGVWRHRICIMLDNCPIHQSKLMLGFIDELRCSYAFIPQYCPEVSPIELFFHQVKKNLSRQSRNEVLNLDSQVGLQELRETIMNIYYSRVRSIWRNFYKELRLALDDVVDILI